MCDLEGSCRELIPYSQQVVTRNGIQVTGFGSKLLYPLSHLNHVPFFLISLPPIYPGLGSKSIAENGFEKLQTHLPLLW